jgi:3-oxoacyl-[acyl-carrier protein] reductase
MSVALVTGGSRGIGAATVLRLARDGLDVAFCYRSAESAADDLAKEAAEFGVRVLPERVDVSDAAAARSWVSHVDRDFGPISVVVTSAGITRDGPLVLMPDANWGDVVNVNLNGVHNVCKPAVFAMMKRRSGCVVTMSSVSGVYGNPSQVNYSAAKAGIIGFTRALAKEVARYGIRVNAVAPGFIETDMTDALDERVRERCLGAVPLGRFGQADEVADLVSFLASVNASYITGTTVEIHGGLAL